MRDSSVGTVAVFRDEKLALLFGLGAAGIAALSIYTPWTLAFLLALPVLVLSAMENETFLLFIIFLLPVGWSLRSEGLLHDVPGAVRLLVLIGFFGGRVFRWDLDVKQLLRPSLARISLWLLAVALASIVFTNPGWTFYSEHSLYRLASYLGFFFFVLAWADSKERIRKILRVLLYSAILTAAFALLQEIIGGYTSLWLRLNPPDDNFLVWDWRATSFLNYPNSLAGFLNLLLPLALACCILCGGEWRRLGRWALALGVLALASTQSVGGLVAFVAILVLAILQFVEHPRKKVVLVAGVFLAAGVFYGLRSVLNPSHSAESIAPDAAIRLVLWSTAWKFFLGSPLFGVGWGNFVGLYGSYTSSLSTWLPAGVFAVHNIYLQLLAETGLAGFTVFFYLMVKSWRLAQRMARFSGDTLDLALAFAVQGAILSILVHGFVDFLFHISPQFGTLFWCLLGLAVASARCERIPTFAARS